MCEFSFLVSLSHFHGFLLTASDHPRQLLDTLAEDGSQPNKWIREQFYEEAMRGLDAEKGRVSMTVVATLGVQWT